MMGEALAQQIVGAASLSDDVEPGFDKQSGDPLS
jgi:hypothetical protein